MLGHPWVLLEGTAMPTASPARALSSRGHRFAHPSIHPQLGLGALGEPKVRGGSGHEAQLLDL